MIAALFVQRNGCYSNLEGVDPWDEARDARLYAGPWPVVAHPPCARWCRLAGLVQHRYGYRKGDDGGCFSSALASVRRWGGVIEHPSSSSAFAAHGITPPMGCGWQSVTCGGWVCYVEQWFYGHPARKGTWLYVFGTVPPPLKWGKVPTGAATAYVIDERGTKRRPAYVTDGGGRVRGTPTDGRKRLGDKAASATPVEFRDLLISIAGSARTQEVAA